MIGIGCARGPEVLAIRAVPKKPFATPGQVR
jgi:hypothetical protein